VFSWIINTNFVCKDSMIGVLLSDVQVLFGKWMEIYFRYR